MGESHIELITCECGDWEVLRVNGACFAEGHQVDRYDWIKLLNHLGFKVDNKEISDEDMEEGNY